VERRLARDRTAILNTSDVQLLDRELRRALADSFPGLPAQTLDRSEDVIRWNSLGARCKEARRTRGLRDASVASGIPQYRIRAVENGYLSDIQPDLARRYFRFLGIEKWVARWCQANRELATRAGVIDPEARRSSNRGRRADGRGSDGRGRAE
jgi:hypothetical protein